MSGLLCRLRLLPLLRGLLLRRLLLRLRLRLLSKLRLRLLRRLWLPLGLLRRLRLRHGLLLGLLRRLQGLTLRVSPVVVVGRHVVPHFPFSLCAKELSLLTH